LGWSTVPVLVTRATVDALQHTMRLLAHLRAAGLDQVAASAVVVVMTTTHSTAREVRAVEHLARKAATHLVRVPFDPVLARPDPLDPRSLSKATRTALTEVASIVVEHCPAEPGPSREGASVA
jgi:MinD-like ATPase involved in chromosome partitioning or flagellar assembly